MQAHEEKKHWETQLDIFHSTMGKVGSCPGAFVDL